jgi:hypothetical protein
MLDLSLAETYVPGCVCAAKAVLLCLWVGVLRVAGVPSFNAHVLGAVLLLLDRRRGAERVVDSNSFACFVLFAIAFRDGRAVAPADVDPRRAVLGVALDVYWAAIGGAALVRVETRLSVFRYVPFRPLALCAVLLASQSFLGQAPELELWTAVRVFVFVALSMLWVYLANARHMSPEAALGCTECAVFFGSVLFTALPVAAVSTLAFLAAIARGDSTPPDETCPDELRPLAPPPAAAPEPVRAEPEPDIEAVFRTAREQAGCRSRASGI